MKILTNYRSKNGYPWKIIERQGDIAIAESGIGYEVIIIQRHNGREINGIYFEPAEYAPSTEQWGVKGWSFKSFEKAKEKFEQLLK